MLQIRVVYPESEYFPSRIPGYWSSYSILFLYRRRGDVFEPWLRQPTFLKLVQGEDVWIETYLKENRCAREREANYSFRKVDRRECLECLTCLVLLF